MGVFPLAVEGTGDLSEPLLMLGWLPLGEMAGLELLRLNMPMAERWAAAGGERSVQSREAALCFEVQEQSRSWPRRGANKESRRWRASGKRLSVRPLALALGLPLSRATRIDPIDRSGRRRGREADTRARRKRGSGRGRRRGRPNLSRRAGHVRTGRELRAMDALGVGPGSLPRTERALPTRQRRSIPMSMPPAGQQALRARARPALPAAALDQASASSLDLDDVEHGAWSMERGAGSMAAAWCRRPLAGPVGDRDASAHTAPGSHQAPALQGLVTKAANYVTRPAPFTCRARTAVDSDSVAAAFPSRKLSELLAPNALCAC